MLSNARNTIAKFFVWKVNKYFYIIQCLKKWIQIHTLAMPKENFQIRENRVPWKWNLQDMMALLEHSIPSEIKDQKNWRPLHEWSKGKSFESYVKWIYLLVWGGLCTYTIYDFWLQGFCEKLLSTIQKIVEYSLIYFYYYFHK